MSSSIWLPDVHTGYLVSDEERSRDHDDEDATEKSSRTHILRLAFLLPLFCAPLTPLINSAFLMSLSLILHLMIEDFCSISIDNYDRRR